MGVVDRADTAVISIEALPGSGTRLGRLMRLPLHLVPRAAVVPILQGPIRGKRGVVGSSIHRCSLGGYESAKAGLASRLARPGAVVFDVGAHAGYYTLIFSQAVGPAGRVVAFEPDPQNVGRLRRHLDLNDAGNVTLVEAAVSDSDESGRFAPGRDSYTGRLDRHGAIQVAAVTLDDLVEAGRVPPPALMKIDVEGAEMQVLAGCRRLLLSHRPTLLLAVHSARLRESCTARLEQCGYRVEPLDSGPADAAELLGTPAEGAGR